MSSAPFLLDGEILPKGGIMPAFWKGLASSGFSLGSTVIAENRPAAAGDSVLFGSGPDAAVFFDKYVPAGSYIVSISSDSGDILLLLGPPAENGRKILGWGGPR